MRLYFMIPSAIFERMNENEITDKIIELSIKIHKKLGPGLLESVYYAILMYELKKAGLHVEGEVPIPVFWDDIKLDVGFRADIIVENKVLIEIKSIENVAPIHKKIFLTYLRLMDKRVGLILNFKNVLLKEGITRVATDFEE
jgi:GxxExxY protein